MNRRDFILAGGAVALSGCVSAVKKTAPQEAENEGEIGAELPLVVGEPCLQNAAETTMCVVWSVNALANGWVEYGRDPALKDARRAVCEGQPGITGFDALAIRVRLQGLEPATRYYYRTVTQKVVYHHNYEREAMETVNGSIHSFTTLGADAPSHFTVINDTHARWEPFAGVTAKARALRPTVNVWNGDAQNCTERPETLVEIFLDPPKSIGYASDLPLLWNNGNHDFRGIWNRWLDRVMMTRTPSERHSRDWALTRNWAVRVGEIAMVGLDTGEDKPDAHPQFAGLVHSEPYRDAQTQWLRDALAREDIKSAPYLVVFCHIPLFDADPRQHPGDVVGNGGGRYTTDYAHWQKQCHDQWAPLLEAAKTTLVVAAHRHRYRFDPADATRSWPQIVGGGCDEKRDKGEYPTVLEGKVEGGRLTLTVHDVNRGEVVAKHAFPPRK